MYINDIIGIQTRIKHLLLTVGVSLDENFSEKPSFKKRENYAVSDAELRATEYEFKKYQMMLKQHDFKSRLTRNAGAIERLRKYKESREEVKSLDEIQKLLDNSHEKWTKCSKNTQRKYITEFIHRRHGVVTKNKSVKKRRAPKFMNTLNLDTIDITNTSADASKDTNENKKSKVTKSKAPDVPEEAKEELAVAVENWKQGLYDNEDMIRYDPDKRQIIDMNLLPGGVEVSESEQEEDTELSESEQEDNGEEDEDEDIDADADEEVSLENNTPCIFDIDSD